MANRTAIRVLVASWLVLCALACGTPVAIEGDYTGECSLGSGSLPFALKAMALDEDAEVNGGDPDWEAYIGTATIDGLPEGDDEARAEALYCLAEQGCTDPVSGEKKAGTLILSFIRSFDLAAVMVLEGHEDAEGRWDGVCWKLAPPTRDVADFGTFEMSAK